MESISKTAVAFADAAAIVRAALGGDATLASSVELTEGWFNAAFTLTLDDGRRVVLKVAPPRDVDVLDYERDIMSAEVDALRIVGRSTTAPVPEVIWFDDEGRHLGTPCFLMTHLPGASLQSLGEQLTAEERDAVDRALGHHLREINEIRGLSFGRLASTADRHPTWRAAFGALFESVLADGERAAVELPIGYADARKALEAAADPLDEVTEPRLVYWDLWEGNVLIDETTHRLTGMLDLERALWGDPLIEGQFGPHTGSAVLRDAYGPIDTTSDGARCRRALYTLHLHLVMSIEGAYRHYPEDVIGEWARSALAEDVARCAR
jgi:aminoglycoside phosphotransferase (APT) family kinase protein